MLRSRAASVAAAAASVAAASAFAAATCVAISASLAGTAAAAAAAPASPPAAAAPALATAALAAAPSGNGAFSSWTAAQRAAGFALLKPTRRHGLTQHGKIHVSTCEVTGQLSKHIVGVVYGSPSRTFLDLDQNNSGRPCGDIGDARPLGTVKVDGVKAQLLGFCGLPGEPGCSSKAIQLNLIWAKHGISYIGSSFGETRSALINFSRSLTPVS